MRTSDKEMAPAVLAHPGARPTDSKGEAVDSKSLTHPTCTVFVNQRLCEEVAELTGIEYRVLSSAFAGEEKNLALISSRPPSPRSRTPRPRTGSGASSPGPKRTVLESTAPATGRATSLPTSTTTTCVVSGGFRTAPLFLGTSYEQGESPSALVNSPVRFKRARGAPLTAPEFIVINQREKGKLFPREAGHERKEWIAER